MKKIIFLLLVTVASYSQTLQNPTFGNVKIKQNTTDNTATKVNVQATDGTVNTISKVDLQDAFYFASASNFPVTGITDKLYIARDNNILYRFNGTIYVPMSADVSGKENTANKQNSLEVDGTGIKYPTVDAINTLKSRINALDASNIDFAGLGDSITFGVGSTSGSTSYLDIINGKVGFKTYTKLAVSGTSVKPATGQAELYTQVLAIPAGTDLITVMIGVNDWYYSHSVGDIYSVLAKSYASLDKTLSFAEAFRYNLETIKINFPTATILVVLPIRTNESNTGIAPFKDYIDAEVAIANYLSIAIVDAYDNSGIYKNSAYIPDGLHPNDTGYEIIAKLVLNNIISPNQQKFQEYKFSKLITRDLESTSNSIFSGNTLFNTDITGTNTRKIDFTTNMSELSVVAGANNRLNLSGFEVISKNKFLADNGVKLNGTNFDLEFEGVFHSIGLSSGKMKVRAFSELVFGINSTGANNFSFKDDGSITATTYNGGATLTGVPTAPTATLGTNTTQIATTAFVLANAQSIPQLESNATDLTVWNNGKGNILNNTSFGDGAFKSNATGQGNTALGYLALNTMSTNSNNTAVGRDALKLSTVSNNTGIGNSSLSNISTGSENTAIGNNSGSLISAGTANSTGNQSVFLGDNTRALNNGETNQIVIGQGATGAGSNTATLGNTSITKTVLRGTVEAPSLIATTGTVRLKGFTVATLPTGVQGDTAYVTDALAPSYLVTVMGGGAVVTVVFFNGSTWVSH